MDSIEFCEYFFLDLKSQILIFNTFTAEYVLSRSTVFRRQLPLYTATNALTKITRFFTKATVIIIVIKGDF